jgi:hypothetical protein
MDKSDYVPCGALSYNDALPGLKNTLGDGPITGT